MDTLLVSGFVLALAGMLGAGCFEAGKILALIPAAFESTRGVWRSPMFPSGNDEPPDQAGRRGRTAQQRARDEERRGRQDQ